MERRIAVLLLIIFVLLFINIPGVREALIGGLETYAPSMAKGIADMSIAIHASPIWQAYGYWLSFFTGIFLTFIFTVRPNLIGKIRGTQQKPAKPHMGGPAYVPPSTLPTTKETLNPIVPATPKEESK